MLAAEHSSANTGKSPSGRLAVPVRTPFAPFVPGIPAPNTPKFPPPTPFRAPRNRSIVWRQRDASMRHFGLNRSLFTPFKTFGFSVAKACYIGLYENAILDIKPPHFDSRNTPTAAPNQFSGMHQLGSGSILIAACLCVRYWYVFS